MQVLVKTFPPTDLIHEAIQTGLRTERTQSVPSHPYKSYLGFKNVNDGVRFI